MKFSGTLPLEASRQQAIEACHAPENLHLLLPVSGRIRRESETHYILTLTPNLPFFQTKLPGTMDVTVVDPGTRYDLVSEAQVWGMGSLRMQAELTFIDAGEACILTYSCHIRSMGVLGKLLKSREDLIRTRVQDGFVRLQKQIAAAGKA